MRDRETNKQTDRQTETERQRHRERETETETERQRDRKTETETERQRETERDSDRDRQTNRQTDRQTDRQRFKWTQHNKTKNKVAQGCANFSLTASQSLQRAEQEWNHSATDKKQILETVLLLNPGGRAEIQ